MVDNKGELDNFKRVAEDFLGSMELCHANGYLQPALVLLYSCIDVMASFDRDLADRHDRTAFIKWVDKYLLPIAGSDITAIDIYAGRCGLVHTYSPDSNLAALGKARKIVLALGPAGVSSLNFILENSPNFNALCTVVQANELFVALQSAIEKFYADIVSNPVKKAQVITNVRIYSYLPSGVINKAAELIRNENS